MNRYRIGLEMKNKDLFQTLILSFPLIMYGFTHPIHAKPPHPKSAPMTTQERYTEMQIGAFNLKPNAQQLQAEWQAKINYPVRIKHQGHLYIVVVGPIPQSNLTQLDQLAHADVMPVRATEPPISEAPQSSRFNFMRTPRFVTQVLETSVIQSDKSWFVGVNGGGFKPSFRATMLVQNDSNFDSPANIDRYSTNAPFQYFASIDGGHYWHRNSDFLPGYAIGLRYQHLFAHRIGGEITQYSDSTFTNYDYKWRIGSDVGLVYTKLELAQFGRFMPYISGGMGVAFNQTSDYREAVRPTVTVRDTPGFKNKTQSQFAYDIGLGFDICLSSHFMMSIGYDFQHFGQMNSGNGVTTWSSQKLDLGKMNGNSAVIGLSYLFNSATHESEHIIGSSVYK
jgi:opacity protein-like surface antigen